MKYNKKVTEWNHKKEIHLYKQEINVRDTDVNSSTRSRSRIPYERMNDEMKKQSDHRRKNYYKKKIHYLTDLAIHNNLETFITLTFRKEVVEYSQAQHEWDLFVKRLKYRYGKQLKYIGVHELQKNRGGVYHFHALLNIRYIPVEELTRI